MSKISQEYDSFTRKIIIIIQIIAILILFSISNKAQAIPEKQDKYFLMTATAYYPGPECTAPFNDGYTAIGHIAGRGCIAIDPEKGPLKFEQKVWIEGYGEGICNDVGSAIQGWEIDLCFDTLEEAQEYGVKLVKVFVIN